MIELSLNKSESCIQIYETDERDLLKVESHFGAMVSFLNKFISKWTDDSQEKRQAIL